MRLISAPGACALAVVEVAGEAASEFLAAMGVKVCPQPGSMRLVSLDLGQGLREQALIVGTPRGLEIQVHGNPLLVETILARSPVVPDQKLASTVSSWEERILRCARQAPARHGLHLALYQLSDAGLMGWLRRVAAGEDPDTIRHEGQQALARVRQARAALRSHRVVLRGRVNSGKSTLFNLLVGRERVRTGPTKALTRDPVEEEIRYRDHALRLVDTAGEAPGLQDLDRRAQAEADRQGQNADLMIWLHSVQDEVQRPPDQEGQLLLETHHVRPDLDQGRLDLIGMDPAAIRIQVLELVFRQLGLEDPAPMAAVPLDLEMEEDLRRILGDPDPVSTARAGLRASS